MKLNTINTYKDSKHNSMKKQAAKKRAVMRWKRAVEAKSKPVMKKKTAKMRKKRSAVETHHMKIKERRVSKKNLSIMVCEGDESKELSWNEDIGS